MAYVMALSAIGILVNIVLVILFIVGFVFLIIGIVNKRREKNKGKAFPVVFIVLGAWLLAAPVFFMSVKLISSVRSDIREMSYESVPEKWRNESVGDNRAAYDVIHVLLEAADEGDRERFASNFAPEIAETDGFSSAMDKFFETYPVGLSECELDGGQVGSSASYREGKATRTGSTNYTCKINGERLRIYLAFCHENDLHPEKVGVTKFYIQNTEAQAAGMDYGSRAVVCNIMSEDGICARLIGGVAYEFTPMPDRVITVDEMRDYLSQYGDLFSLSCAIGEPNVTKKYSNVIQWTHIYELAPVDGEARYVELSTEGKNGEIVSAYLLNETDTLYGAGMLPDDK